MKCFICYAELANDWRLLLAPSSLGSVPSFIVYSASE